MLGIDRRGFLTTASAIAASAAAPRALRAAKPLEPGSISLGFSLYGMKDLEIEEAIRLLSKISYDAVELCLIPGWGAASGKLDPKRRKAIGKLLGSEGLQLPGLMEHVSLVGTKQQQQAVHERLKRAAELGHDICPDTPPLIETTAGSGNFDQLRDQLLENLRGWARVARAAETVIAVKPHRGGVVDRPEQAVWLVQQVDSPWIKLNYDYSHFAHRDIPLAESVRVMMPHTRFIAVKDTVIRDGRAVFLLPGEGGQFDYAELLKLVDRAGYRGSVCCEVSSMVSRQKGYDPVAAARTCYHNLAPAFQRAGIRRPKRPAAKAPR